MAHSSAKRSTPYAVESVIAKLGGNIAEARLRRGMSQQELATRAGVSRATVARLEKGSPRVELSAVVAALWVMDLHHELAETASFAHDPVGATLAQSRLGERARAATTTLDDDF